jgi:hypothetical protein
MADLGTGAMTISTGGTGGGKRRKSDAGAPASDIILAALSRVDKRARLSGIMVGIVRKSKPLPKNKIKGS